MSTITQTATSTNYPSAGVASDVLENETDDADTTSVDQLVPNEFDDNSSCSDEADEESLGDNEFAEEESDANPANLDGDNNETESVSGHRDAATMAYLRTRHRNEYEQRRILYPFTQSLSPEQVEAHISRIYNEWLPREDLSIPVPIDEAFPTHSIQPCSEDHPSTSCTPECLNGQSARVRRKLLQALIRSLGPRWKSFIDDPSDLKTPTPSDDDSESTVEPPNQPHQPQSSPAVSQPLNSDQDSSGGERRYYLSCCPKVWPRYTRRERLNGNGEPLIPPYVSIRMVHFSQPGHTTEPTNVTNDCFEPEEITGTRNSPCGRFFTFNNNNTLYGGLIIIIILLVAILGTACFFWFSPTVARPPNPQTPNIQKSQVINASGAKVQLAIDHYHHNVLVTKQHEKNRSHIETTFLDGAYLHDETVLHRILKTNETCVQVTLEIICCETFCEGVLKEGLIANRTFAHNSHFCGAWRTEMNSAYFCTRKGNQITITEFWSARDYRFSHHKLNIAAFQAIDYLPKHIAIVLTRSSSNTDQFCLAHFGKKIIKQMKCHDIDFLGLEPIGEGIKRHIVYLQHLTWAIISSKLVDNSLEWTTAIFKDKRLVLQQTDKVFSEDHQLVAYGGNGELKVCGIELDTNQNKLVSCAIYEYQM